MADYTDFKFPTSNTTTDDNAPLSSPSIDIPNSNEHFPSHNVNVLSPTVDKCTSNWTSHTLHMLQIEPVTTEVYTPMQLLSFTFSDNVIFSSASKETTDMCKNLIINSRCPLHKLDIDDLENSDTFECFRLLMDKTLNGQWSHKVDLWNISPHTFADKLDKLQTRICQKFQVHGEIFAQQLIFMNMAKKKASLTKAMYGKLFEHFAGLFGLNTTTVSDSHTIQIGDTDVTSTGDIIFPDLVNSDENNEDMNVIALCKVTNDFQSAHGLNEVAKTVNCGHKRKRSEILVTHIYDALIGQIGGDLLAHIPLSKYNGILGIIVQKTFITFVHLRCDQVQLDRIKRKETNFASKPVIFFSKPYNYLKASDRNELREPLLRLAFLQFRCYQ
ncbi:unnamed protein product [Mytilus coruscus]|uniref:Uncharacterized protein n=1 Tax=Mytilus coruscus TaxID=42192 RepID=A0A6J8AC81_MYTCO|nr:unnamed protein product [Mytilus coruscus]